jgi:anti-sigma regulatory factor (Ser/Thr protein kinase)
MLTITVPAVTEALEQVNAFSARLATDAGLSPYETYRLRLATEELFVNIVRHGYGEDRMAGQVTIEGHATEHGAWLRLIDTAAPFDPFQAASPAGLDLPLKDREPGALGLYLARHAVDAASHEYARGANRSTIAVLRGRDDADGRNPHGGHDVDRE